MSTSSCKHSCKYCGKEYTRKTAHSRHVILCEIFYKNNTQTRREKDCEEEESTSIPSTDVPIMILVLMEFVLKRI